MQSYQEINQNVCTVCFMSSHDIKRSDLDGKGRHMLVLHFYAAVTELGE